MRKKLMNLFFNEWPSLVKKKLMNLFFFFFTFYTVGASIELFHMLRTSSWESAQGVLGLWLVSPITQTLTKVATAKDCLNWGEFGMDFEIVVFILVYVIWWVCMEIPLWPYFLLCWCWIVVIHRYYTIIEEMKKHIDNDAEKKMRKKKRMNIFFFVCFALYTVISSIELLRMLHIGDWESAQQSLGLWFASPILDYLKSYVQVYKPRLWGDYGVWLEIFIFILVYFIEWVCTVIPLWSYILLGWCWKVVIHRIYTMIKEMNKRIENGEDWNGED